MIFRSIKQIDQQKKENWPKIDLFYMLFKKSKSFFERSFL